MNLFFAFLIVGLVCLYVYYEQIMNFVNNKIQICNKPIEFKYEWNYEKKIYKPEGGLCHVWTCTHKNYLITVAKQVTDNINMNAIRIEDDTKQNYFDRKILHEIAWGSIDKAKLHAEECIDTL